MYLSTHALSDSDLVLSGAFHSFVIPLHVVPQTSQMKVAFSVRDELSRRIPQSVQNNSEPIADMMLLLGSTTVKWVAVI